LAGQVDAIDGFPLATLTQVQGKGDLEIVAGPSGTFTPFVMNAAAKPFQDVRVRQAMRLILDRKGMNEQVLLGKGTIANDVVSPFDPFYIGDELPQREQDLEQAKSLLAAAGQQDLRITLDTSAINPGALEQSQVIVEQAKGAGVTIKLNQIDPAQFYTTESGYTSYPFSVSLGGTGGSYLADASAVYPKNAPYQESHWGDEEWERIYNEATKTVDDSKRGELIGELQRIEYERGTYIIWCFLPTLTAVNAKKVRGVKPIQAQFGLNDYQYQTLSVA
jgi:peptide/nickel transport system substrate-binding protein